MTKKKILIVTHGFFPEQSPRSFRATELAKEFCRQGHEVTVMAPFRKGTKDLTTEFGFTFKSLGTLNWGIFNFKNFGFFGRFYNKAVNRLLPLLFEYPSMELYFKVKNKLENEKETYDLLISIAVPYPIHWGVASVWKLNGLNITKTWIADCGDPYCLQENDTFQPPFYFKKIEKWFMRKADYVSVPTANSFKGYFPEFHYKLRVIPQGFRFEDVNKLDLIQDGIIRFGYGGSFIQGRRDPKEMIKFLVNLPEAIKFEFHIFTSTPHLVLPHINNDKRIILRERISRLNLLEVLSTFNFIVNFSNKGTAQTPSKLIDYAIIQKPILNVETGNLDEKTILNFLKGDYSNRLVVEDAESYKIENVAKSFIKLI